MEETPQSPSVTAPLAGEPGSEKPPLKGEVARRAGGVSSRQRAIFTIDDVRKRGLIWDGHSLPYNPNLVENALSLRKDMTNAEKKLWYDFLRSHEKKFYRQRPIDHFLEILRFTNADILKQFDAVCRAINKKLQRNPSVT
ncbi:MAG: DUF559 domain-containing protein, partial [Chitinivibrionales bacterium]